MFKWKHSPSKQLEKNRHFYIIFYKKRNCNKTALSNDMHKVDLLMPIINKPYSLCWKIYVHLYPRRYIHTLWVQRCILLYSKQINSSVTWLFYLIKLYKFSSVFVNIHDVIRIIVSKHVYTIYQLGLLNCTI